MTPVLLVHPSLEMAVLHKEGRTWRISTLDAYASLGLTRALGVGLTGRGTDTPAWRRNQWPGAVYVTPAGAPVVRPTTRPSAGTAQVGSSTALQPGFPEMRPQRKRRGRLGGSVT
jgi:hypothetical protein